MCDKLWNMNFDGDVKLSDYDQQFVNGVRARLIAFIPLTDKQEKYLEEIFHNKY